MIKNRIWEKQGEISKRTKTDVIIAYDGMNLEI